MAGCSVADGEADDHMTKLHTSGKCSCPIHHSPDQRKPGGEHDILLCFFRTGGGRVGG